MQINHKTRKQVLTYFIKEKEGQVAFILKIKEKIKIFLANSQNKAESFESLEDYLSDNSKKALSMLMDNAYNTSIEASLSSNIEKGNYDDMMFVYYILLNLYSDSSVSFNHNEIKVQLQALIKKKILIGKIIESLLSKFSLISNEMIIKKFKKIYFKIVGRESKINAVNYKNICGTTVLVTLILKDILVYLGVIYERKANNIEKHNNFISQLLLKTEEERSILERISSKENKKQGLVHTNK